MKLFLTIPSLCSLNSSFHFFFPPLDFIRIIILKRPILNLDIFLKNNSDVRMCGKLRCHDINDFFLCLKNVKPKSLRFVFVFGDLCRITQASRKEQAAMNMFSLWLRAVRDTFLLYVFVWIMGDSTHIIKGED